MAQIIPFGPARATGVEAPTAPVSFGVTPLDVARINRIFAPRPDPVEMLRAYRPTFGERLVTWFRFNGDRVQLAIFSFSFGGLAFAALVLL
jgi:hypothetical protein